MDSDHLTVESDAGDDIEEALAVRDAAIVQLTLSLMYAKREIAELRDALRLKDDQITKH